MLSLFISHSRIETERKRDRKKKETQLQLGKFSTIKIMNRKNNNAVRVGRFGGYFAANFLAFPSRFPHKDKEER
jgi:hypothetical protein